MAVEVTLRNERTGEFKRIKVGWSWVLFLFSSALGIPLFVRGLYQAGAGMAVLALAAGLANELNSPIYRLFVVLQIVASVQFGRGGNRLTAVKYLENGWVWAEPDDQPTLYAREKWALA